MTTNTNTQLDLWKAEWRDVYDDELENILNNETEIIEWKKFGVTFLSSVNENMNEVLADLHNIRNIFDKYNQEHLIFKGIENVLVGFEYKECFAHEEGIVKFYNKSQQVILDPFVLENEMMAEFVATVDSEHYFYINIRIYEDDSERIDFDFECQTPEEKTQFEESKARFNSIRFEISEDDEDYEDEYEEDEDNFPVDDELLKKLSEMKFNNIKYALEPHPFVDDIELQEHTNDDGELTYLIQIHDKSLSLTTIMCDKNGWKTHWGSSTPVPLKAIIEETMMKL